MLMFLSEDIWVNIVEYLHYDDRRHLRGTNAAINREANHKIGYLRLNRYYTYNYLSNMAFRYRVYNSVADSRQQISLKFWVWPKLLTPFFYNLFATVHAFDFGHSTFTCQKHFKNDGIAVITQRKEKENVFDISNAIINHQLGCTYAYTCGSSYFVYIGPSQSYIEFK